MSDAPESITYQHLWDACDRERTDALAWFDVHSRKPNPEFAAAFQRRHAIFEALQKMVGRIAESAMIKNELAEIALRERLAADTEKDSEGTDDDAATLAD
jgi:hypothetical protein